jgi:hypothetical protein
MAAKLRYRLKHNRLLLFRHRKVGSNLFLKKLRRSPRTAMLHVTTADGRSFKLAQYVGAGAKSALKSLPSQAAHGTEGPGRKQTGKTTRSVVCWGTEKELARTQQRRY